MKMEQKNNIISYLKLYQDLYSDEFYFNKINTTDDIRASIEAMARTNAKAIKKRTRGKVTWKETNAAAELATLTGQNVNRLAANL